MDGLPGSMGLNPDSMELSDAERRLVACWAAQCAERALPLFERRAPSDGRPRDAIEGARGYALGGRRTGLLRTLAWAALAAARDVGEPAAAAAARAAAVAVGVAYMHALATAHQSKHALAPAAYSAQALELAAGGDSRVGDEEIRWAIGQAPPGIGEILRRMPAREPGRGRLASLMCQLDAGLRG